MFNTREVAVLVTTAMPWTQDANSPRNEHGRPAPAPATPPRRFACLKPVLRSEPRAELAASATLRVVPIPLHYLLFTTPLSPDSRHPTTMPRYLYRATSMRSVCSTSHRGLELLPSLRSESRVELAASYPVRRGAVARAAYYSHDTPWTLRTHLGRQCPAYNATHTTISTNAQADYQRLFRNRLSLTLTYPSCFLGALPTVHL
jgi:hypothetical protein